MSQDHDHSRERDALEELLANALQAQEAGGNEAVDAFVAAHPAHAAALRQALADLGTIDLLQVPREVAPTWFGEFRIRELLGAGGMGIVYLAEQTSLGREVALKVVRPELLFFDGARERFQREIDAVARLEHPAIVPILATGHAEGVPYYAMPRIHGRSADAVCRALAARVPAAMKGADLRAALTVGALADDHTTDGAFAGTWWQAVVRLVHQAALGIAHAHARGVLHRDLKPSNLMLTADGRAIVLDFGLAVARGDAKLTRTGTAAGSPAYMAPEQVRGEHADERTDVYGLAAILHCLLGLRAPFAATAAETLKSEILAGARQDLRHAGIPAELRLVLDQAMDVEPARRHRSASALADDLQAVLDGRPITARGLPVRVRLQRFARRHRALTTALAAAGLFVLVVPSVLLWQQRHANELLSEQVKRSNRSAKVSVDAVQKLLAAVARDRMRHVPEAQEVAAEMLRGAIELFDDLRADATQAQRAHDLGTAALIRLSEVEASRGRRAEATAAARAANDRFIDGDLTPLSRLQRVNARRFLAGLLLEAGHLSEAEQLANSCQPDVVVLLSLPEYSRRAQNQQATLLYHTAVLAQRRGDAVAEEEALRNTVAILEGGDRLAMAGSRTRLAGFLRRQQRAEEALPLAETAITIATSDGVPTRGWPVPKHVEALARQEQGDTLVVLGREGEAIEAFREALRAFDQFVRDYPEEPISRSARGATANNLALIFYRQRRWSEARPLLAAACVDQLAVLARDPHDAQARSFLAQHRQTLASCLGKLGDLQALEPVARELAAMDGSPGLQVGAARGLLRCANAADAERAAMLRREALVLLVGAAERGGLILFDDELYAPVRDAPELARHRQR